ncbi:hypothetical protein [Ornithinimicrobium kibberense]|uniref:hypothetical protein n=1 Tax=Ornithinimicrobium kibberense TaxID=282060 RepID=UPI0036234EC4
MPQDGGEQELLVAAGDHDVVGVGAEGRVELAARTAVATVGGLRQVVQDDGDADGTGGHPSPGGQGVLAAGGQHPVGDLDDDPPVPQPCRVDFRQQVGADEVGPGPGRRPDPQPVQHHPVGVRPGHDVDDRRHLHRHLRVVVGPVGRGRGPGAHSSQPHAVSRAAYLPIPVSTTRGCSA